MKRFAAMPRCAWRHYRCATARRRWGLTTAGFATVGKPATSIYRLLRLGQPYMDEGAEPYEKRYQEARIKSLVAKAKELGYRLTPTTA